MVPQKDFKMILVIMQARVVGIQNLTIILAAYHTIKGPDNPTCVFFRKSVAVDTIGSLSKGTSECASVSQ